MEPLALEPLTRHAVQERLKALVGVDKHGKLDYGATCDTCGLSEFGQRRLRSNGYRANPCKKCPEELR